MATKKSQIVTMPMVFRGVASLVSGKSTWTLAPATFPRVLAQADLYELYRFTSFRFRLLPPSSSDLFVAGYYSGFIDSAPAFADVNENPISCMIATPVTEKTEWVHVPPNMLAGSLQWYKSIAGTVDTWDEVQGQVCFASSSGSSTGPVNFEFEGTVQFTSPADPGATPMERARKHQEKEKERILRLLSAPSSGNALDSTQHKKASATMTGSGSQPLRDKGFP